ncbi:MAG: hypothetical protein E6G97_21780 [Alphaproteobacteria bacterium]|nr:MAG: hypothetical protein E6G97_21780 [Alphaproteobacteria bacterium]
MSKVREFANTALTMTVGIIGVTSQQVQFMHNGARYAVARENLLEISENTSARDNIQGRSALIRIKADAELILQAEASPEVPEAVIPFGLRQPAAPVPFSQSSADRIWREQVGYPFSGATRMSALDSWANTDSTSGGQKDDNKSDKVDHYD